MGESEETMTKEERKVYQAAYYVANKDKIKAYQKEHQSKWKDKIKARRIINSLKKEIKE